MRQSILNLIVSHGRRYLGEDIQGFRAGPFLARLGYFEEAAVQWLGPVIQNNSRGLLNGRCPASHCLGDQNEHAVRIIAVIALDRDVRSDKAVSSPV